MTSGRPAPAVEVLPEGTLRDGPRGSIGARTAFVIDSSATVQLIAHTLLKIAGFSVEIFAAPRAALQRAVELRPDVVVLEPRSPGIDAFATMRALSGLHGAEAAPVVWCTTVEPTADAVEEGARLGLRGVLVKPFRLGALSALVLRVCRRADRERRLAKLGIPPDELTTRILSDDATRLWTRAEIELADAARAPHSLSLVAVGADTGRPPPPSAAPCAPSTPWAAPPRTCCWCCSPTSTRAAPRWSPAGSPRASPRSSRRRWWAA
jgi:DNA-binding response OmpR family regulator